MLDKKTVTDLASVLTLEDGAFIVGGQAVNLLAEYYADRAPELAHSGPYTSKDVDYFGKVQAAQKLAEAINGTLRVPDPYDNTPTTAIVEGEVNGAWVQIDFLGSVLGTKADKLATNAIELVLPVVGEDRYLLLPVMNPLHCYQSRIGNACVLHRRTGIAETQLIAAHYVLRSYIDELANEDVREAKKVLQAFFKYLKGDVHGRRAHKENPIDPIDIFYFFASDERFDAQYRWFNIRPMQAELLARRILPSPPLPKSKTGS